MNEAWVPAVAGKAVKGPPLSEAKIVYDWMALVDETRCQEIGKGVAVCMAPSASMALTSPVVQAAERWNAPRSEPAPLNRRGTVCCWFAYCCAGVRFRPNELLVTWGASAPAMPAAVDPETR